MSPLESSVPAGGPVLAHGGGLPEVATVGLPLLVLLVFVLLERRARRREREAEQSRTQDDTA